MADQSKSLMQNKIAMQKNKPIQNVYEPNVTTTLQVPAHKRYMTPNRHMQQGSIVLSQAGRGLSSPGFNNLSLITHSRQPEYSIQIYKGKKNGSMM